MSVLHSIINYIAEELTKVDSAISDDMVIGTSHVIYVSRILGLSLININDSPTGYFCSVNCFLVSEED